MGQVLCGIKVVASVAQSGTRVRQRRSASGRLVPDYWASWRQREDCPGQWQGTGSRDRHGPVTGKKSREEPPLTAMPCRHSSKAQSFQTNRRKNSSKSRRWLARQQPFQRRRGLQEIRDPLDSLCGEWCGLALPIMSGRSGSGSACLRPWPSTTARTSLHAS